MYNLGKDKGDKQLIVKFLIGCQLFFIQIGVN